MKKQLLTILCSIFCTFCIAQVFVGTPQNADNDPNKVGAFSSLATVAGRPSIAYYDESNGDLKFIRANDANGNTWGKPQTIDAANNVGRYISLAIINGNPAISYHDVSNRSLKYVRASDAEGLNWGSPVVVEPPRTSSPADNTGWFTNLLAIDGNPAIAYLQFMPNGLLKFIRANDANGNTWGTAVVLDNPGPAAYLSMSVVNGNPAISYFHNYSSLKYIRATSVTGSAWGSPQTIVVSEAAYTSLGIVNGNPAITYTNVGALSFVRANDSGGTTWAGPQIIDKSGSDYTSLKVIDGLPAIAHGKIGLSGMLNLNLSISKDANGNVWNTPLLLDDAGNVGMYPSLNVINNNPAVSYFDFTNGNLKYIRSDSPYLRILAVQLQQEEELVIYPNPSFDQITVKIPANFAFKRMEIMNEMGVIAIASDKSTLFTKGLPTGNYFVKVYTFEGRTFTKKITMN